MVAIERKGTVLLPKVSYLSDSWSLIGVRNW